MGRGRKRRDCKEQTSAAEAPHEMIIAARLKSCPSRADTSQAGTSQAGILAEDDRLLQRSRGGQDDEFFHGAIKR